MSPGEVAAPENLLISSPDLKIVVRLALKAEGKCVEGGEGLSPARAVVCRAARGCGQGALGWVGAACGPPLPAPSPWGGQPPFSSHGVGFPGSGTCALRRWSRAHRCNMGIIRIPQFSEVISNSVRCVFGALAHTHHAAAPEKPFPVTRGSSSSRGVMRALVRAPIQPHFCPVPAPFSGLKGRSGPEPPLPRGKFQA